MRFAESGSKLLAESSPVDFRNLRLQLAQVSNTFSMAFGLRIAMLTSSWSTAFTTARKALRMRFAYALPLENALPLQPKPRLPQSQTQGLPIDTGLSAFSKGFHLLTEGVAKS
ncbi:MAG: hypothetical protein ACPLZY_02770 [Candidatus Norongarragalinales archaeon]